VLRTCSSLEAAANTVVRYFYDHCVDLDVGERTSALVRFYATQPFGRLPAELQQIASAQLESSTPHARMRCLTLLASAGDEAQWNSRHTSRGHRAIPLLSADSVRRTPMIAGLIEDLGGDIESIVQGGHTSRPIDSRNYDVFHVEEALGSPLIPAQEEFVVPYRIHSVVGFGGLLRTTELFAVVIFSRAPIAAASANRFRTIALDIRSALFSLEDSQVWSA
jgi:hypothetical protein